VPANSLQDAIMQTNLLSDNKGAFAQLLQAVADNTTIKSAPELQAMFASLHDNLAPTFSHSFLNKYFAQLQQMPSDLQGLAASSNQNRDAQQYAARLLSGAGSDSQLHKTMLFVDTAVEPITPAASKQALQTLLLQPVRAAWRGVLVAATQGLEQQWQSQVYNHYQQNIASQFPFNRNANTDSALSDVNDFFQPKNGLLWTFVNTDLAPYLYNDLSGWHEQQWLGVGAGFSPQFLTALTEAKQLSENLFKNGGSTPGFSFQIYPEPTPGLSQIILSVNGQSYRYQNGPQQWQLLNWPGGQIDNSSELTAIAANGLSPNTLQAQGAWGLFHLLAQSHLQATTGNIYRATWTLNGGSQPYTVSLLLQGDSHANIFQQLLTGNFNLPAQLFAEG
jgi:type VI secretion system protein ImpL